MSAGTKAQMEGSPDLDTGKPVSLTPGSVNIPKHRNRKVEIEREIAETPEFFRKPGKRSASR